MAASYPGPFWLQPTPHPRALAAKVPPAWADSDRWTPNDATGVSRNQEVRTNEGLDPP